MLNTPKFDETVAWYRETLGFICSDDVYAGDKSHLIGSFNRLDRGDDYVDHHVFFCLRHQKTGLNHLSFEVQDIDDVAMGHNYLKQFGKYEHMWGLGRHLLGSQVYDYWADPWGRVHEHWADSDRLNVRNGSHLLPAEEALVSQWGGGRRKNSSITRAREAALLQRPDLTVGVADMQCTPVPVTPNGMISLPGQLDRAVRVSRSPAGGQRVAQVQLRAQGTAAIQRHCVMPDLLSPGWPQAAAGAKLAASDRASASRR